MLGEINVDGRLDYQLVVLFVVAEAELLNVVKLLVLADCSLTTLGNLLQVIDPGQGGQLPVRALVTAGL